VIAYFPVRVALIMRRKHSTVSAFYCFFKVSPVGTLALSVAGIWMSKSRCCSGNRRSTEKHLGGHLESLIEDTLFGLGPLCPCSTNDMSPELAMPAILATRWDSWCD
jgi:hypothetical protein